MDLRVFFEPTIDLERLSGVLDALGHQGRLWSSTQWTGPQLAALHEAAKGFRPISVADFVPEGTDPLKEVIHHGKNSLPAFNHFQKRFCLPVDPADRERMHLWGYNHQSMSGFTGPGYFVARPGDAEGEVDIDYTLHPKAKAESWPEIVPAEAKLGRFVYGGMVDVMRGISSHVTIGRARKKGQNMDAWFVLVRQDLS